MVDAESRDLARLGRLDDCPRIAVQGLGQFLGADSRTGSRGMILSALSFGGSFFLFRPIASHRSRTCCWRSVQVQYENRFSAAGITAVRTPTVMEDQSCLYYPAKLVNVS